MIMVNPMNQKGLLVVLFIILLSVSLSPVTGSTNTDFGKNGDIELKIRGGLGYWIIVTNNLDQNISVDFMINGSGILTNRTFNDTGSLSVQPQFVALYKGSIPGFMKISVTVEAGGETLTRSGISFARFILFLP